MKKLIVLIIVLFSVSLNAQQAGSLDNSFNSNDVGFDFWDGFNNYVRSTALQTDGKIILVGDFTTYKNVYVNNIIRLNSDGSVDSTFNLFDFTNYFSPSSISTILIQTDGKILIGGRLNQSSNTAFCARLNNDGTFDTSFPLINQPSGSFASMNVYAIQSDGKIIASGPGGYASPGMYRYNTDGSLDTTFSGPNNISDIKSVDIQLDGKIIVGGRFGIIIYNNGNINVNNIVRLNQDGSHDSSFNTGTGFLLGTSQYNSDVSAIKILNDGKILVGGEFNNFNGNPVKGLVKLNSDGTLDSSFNYFVSGSNLWVIVKNISVLPDNKIVISGSLYSPSNVSRLNSDGSIDSTFNLNLNLSLNKPSFYGTFITSQNIQSDGKILIGGYFDIYDDVGRKNFIRFNQDGSLDSSFSTGVGTGANDYINDIVIQPNSQMIIGGYFTAYNGIVRKKIARIDTNGNLDENFNPVFSLSSEIKLIALQNDGKIFVAGIFGNVNNTPTKPLVRLNSDGSLDSSFNFFKTGGIKALAIQTDGKILVGGGLGSVVSATSVDQSITRLNTDGSKDMGFSVTSNNQVYTCAIQNDGKIIIGGNFTTINGVTKKGIARLNSDGSLDLSFDPVFTQINQNQYVSSICIQDDGKVIIYSQMLNTYLNNYLFRVDTNGITDASFNSGIGPNNIVNKILYQPNGKITLVGAFTKYDNIINNNIVRINSDGSLDNGFNSGNGGNNIIYSAALEGNDKVMIVGAFTGYDGAGRNRIARINNSTPLSNNLFNNDKKLLFYPNPTNNYIHFDTNFKSISIFSIDGKLISTYNDLKKIDVSFLSKGTYIINTIDENDVSFSEKLIKL